MEPELLPGHLTSIGIAGVVVAVLVLVRLSQGPNLDAIPTVGSSSWLGSWWAGFKYLTNAVDVIQEGYEKHKTAPFKIADRVYWTVVVSSREHVEELIRAPEEELSLVEAVDDRLNTRCTLGHEVHDWPYHVGAICTLTRNIGTLYPAIRDEIVTTFNEILDLRGEEWKSIPVVDISQKVVCRTSNRLFVGLPLCRNPDWVDLNIRYAQDIGKAGILLGLFPKFIRPLAVCLFPDVARGLARGLKYLSPIIEERLRDISECGNDGVESPNDLISWLIQESKGPAPTVKSLATRILFVNVTAIHTSSNSFAYALFFLAEYPQYIQPLREEVEGVVEKQGWSKAALSKMRKIDSFVKECQRLEGMSALAIMRKALKDFTFSDRTFIPKGTLICVATRSLHHEEKLYEDANTFQPFRFAGTQGEVGDDLKDQLISTSMEYLIFGHGKHSCPGRFFAANELKSMLAHVVVTYDLKLEDNATRPHSLRFGVSIIADPHARILFRKRVK